MAGRMPIKANIRSGLRRRSLVRSASLRSGLATICAICSDESCGELCCGDAARKLSSRTALTAIAARRPFRLIFIGLPLPIPEEDLWRFRALSRQKSRPPLDARDRAPVLAMDADGKIVAVDV